MCGLWRGLTDLMSMEEHHALQPGGARKHSTGKSRVTGPLRDMPPTEGSTELFHPQLIQVWMNYLVNMNVACVRSQFSSVSVIVFEYGLMTLFLAAQPFFSHFSTI